MTQPPAAAVASYEGALIGADRYDAEVAKPDNAATRRPAAPRRGAPGDDTGSLRVGWLQWIRRQLSADRAALAGSHLTHPKRTHSSDHLPSVCPNRTSARGGAQWI